MKQYMYLPKHLKPVVNAFDPETVDWLLKEEMYGELAYILNIIANMYEEGQPMSQFHEAGIDYIYTKWGDDTQRVLCAMRGLVWEEIKAGKYKKPVPISREERMKRRYASFEKFKTTTC